MKTISRHIHSLNRDIDYLLGKNAKDNFDIIDESKENDIWFHINGEPSCHVIAILEENIKYNKKELRQIVTQGALLCKENSKFKSMKNVDVVYTNVSNLCKTEILGTVSVSNSKLISV
jgi:predicted ribosome quality control (RQC) complex YloA/Tae2 family protein